MSETPGTRASLPAKSRQDACAPGNAGFQPAESRQDACATKPTTSVEEAGRMPALPGTDACAPGWRSRGYLPHFDKPGLIQSITYRLFDSVPADVISKWQRELEWAEYVSADDPRAVELRKRIAAYEDQGYGACWLRRADCAAVVQNAMLHFDAERYRLIEWCVMPNHVHALIEPLAGHTLDKILHSWKSYTSSSCNRILGRTGRFWIPEYHDRYIRSPKHFENAVNYIRENPVKAGLCKNPEDWKWSSPGTRASLPATSPGNAGFQPATSVEEAGRMPALPGEDACAPRNII